MCDRDWNIKLAIKDVCDAYVNSKSTGTCLSLLAFGFKRILQMNLSFVFFQIFNQVNARAPQSPFAGYISQPDGPSDGVSSGFTYSTVIRTTWSINWFKTGLSFLHGAMYLNNIPGDDILHENVLYSKKQRFY